MTYNIDRATKDLENTKRDDELKIMLDDDSIIDIEGVVFINDVVCLKEKSRRQVCIDIIEEKDLTTEEIYEFFNYCKEQYLFVNECMIIKYGLLNKTYEQSIMDLVQFAEDEWDFFDEKERFLGQLIICAKKYDLDVMNGFVYWRDENEFDYFESPSEVTKSVYRWLKENMFDDCPEIQEKLFEILRRR